MITFCLVMMILICLAGITDNPSGATLALALTMIACCVYALFKLYTNVDGGLHITFI